MMIGICIGVMMQNNNIVLRYNDLATKYNNLSRECPSSENYGKEIINNGRKIDFSDIFKDVMKN